MISAQRNLPLLPGKSSACVESAGLSSPRTITRRLIMQKAGRHPLNLRFKIFDLRFYTAAMGAPPTSRKSQIANSGGSDTLYAFGCRYYFTPLTGVLFTFPSRYWFTIGCQGVFSLIRWSGQIRTEFHVHRATWDTPRGL